MPNLVTLAKSKVYQIFKDSSIVDEGVEHVVLHGFEALLHGAAVESEAAYPMHAVQDSAFSR